MAEQLTVTLSHDDWQWVMSLVLNGAYVRAKPVVEAVDAAVKNANEVKAAQAVRDQGERDDLRRQAQQAHWDLGGKEREVDALRQENKRLMRQVDGYKGQAAKRKRRGNGHVDAEAPVRDLMSRELADARAALAGESFALAGTKQALEESRRTIGLLQERIRTGAWPGGVEITGGIEIEAELTDSLEQADDHG